MPYERTRKIEERFTKAIFLIGKKRLTAEQLAKELEVSLPTAHRIITELRRRGYNIQSVRDEYGWRYQITNEPNLAKKKAY